MNKILLAYDASPDAEFALQNLSDCGFRDGVEVRVLTVADDRCFQNPEPFAGCPEESPLDIEELEEVREIAAERAIRARDVLRETLPGWQVHAVPELGEARRAIRATAECWPADLVVVGVHGYRRVSTEPLGSVASYLTHHAVRSIRVVRGEQRPLEASDRPPVLMIGFDGSPDAQRAVSRVGRGQWPKRTRVLIVAVASLPDEAKMREASAEPQARGLVARERGLDAARRAANAVAQDLAASGVLAEAVVLDGDPATRLLEAAADHKVGAVFVGACGNTQLDRVRLGGVSSRVVKQAPCTVEVVREAQ